MKMDKMVLSGFLLGGKQPIMLNTFRPDVCEIADKLQVLLLIQTCAIKWVQQDEKSLNVSLRWRCLRRGLLKSLIIVYIIKKHLTMCDQNTI